MTKLKWIEHVLAVVGAGAVAFVASPAGQAVAHQYPVLAPIFAAVGFLAAFYHSPKASQ